VQTALKENPFSGQVFVFRGRRGDLIKMLWWSGDGLCLFAKRLERGRFIWPQATSGTVALTPAQLWAVRSTWRYLFVASLPRNSPAYIAAIADADTECSEGCGAS